MTDCRACGAPDHPSGCAPDVERIVDEVRQMSPAELAARIEEARDSSPAEIVEREGL